MLLNISQEGFLSIKIRFNNKVEKSTESELSAKDRDTLPDSVFGISELRKYPLIDADHVRSAISYFNKSPAKYKHSLAVRICRAAKKFDIEISKDSPVWKAAHE